MNNYSPFERGPFTVGVKSADFTCDSRDRTIPVECWYPADESEKGKDLDPNTQDKYAVAPGFPENPQTAFRDANPQTKTLPLIIFSHGFAGHRRQTTHFCCHLASHGYMVLAPDHVGNTLMDIMGLAGQMQKGGLASMGDHFQSFKDNRPADASMCIDLALDGRFGLSADPERIGISGHSFGGWTTLATCMQDSRISAALPLAPAGGVTQGSIANGLDFSLPDIDYGRSVPTLYLVADKDTLLPLEGMHDLYNKTPEPKKMFILENSDHFHFCDNVEFIHDAMTKMGGTLFGTDNKTGALSKMHTSAELCSGESAYKLIQGLGLAHMDAFVNKQAHAQAFLDQDIEKLLAEKDVIVSAV